MSRKTDISKKLEEYKKLQLEIHAMEEVINGKYQTLNEISKEVVTVRLSDLICELSKLAGMPESCIDVRIGTHIRYYGLFSKEELTRLRANHTQGDVWIDENIMVVKLAGRKWENETWNKVFSYNAMFLNFDMVDVQADGKTLYDHMGTRKNINSEGRYYTQFVVDRKIDKVILDIPVRYLTRDEESYWYPVDLFTQAVLNCANKSYSSRNQYVRARTRKDR